MGWIRSWLGDMKARSWFVALLAGTNMLYWILPLISRYSMSLVVLPFALILLAVQLARREIRWNAYAVSLFLMAAFYILAWARNLDLSYRATYPLILSCASMTIVGIVPKDCPEKTLRTETLTLAAMILTVMVSLAIVGMTSVFVGRKLPFLWKEACVGLKRNGRPNSRIYLLMHPNASASMCAMAILFAIHWLNRQPTRWLKGVLACAIVPLAFAIIHCQSRSCNIAMATGVGALIFRALYLRGFRGKKRIWVALAAWVLTFFCLLWLSNVIFQMDMRVAKALLKTENTGRTVSRTVTDGTFDMLSNGRGSVWSITLRYLLKHPSKLLLGMGSGDLIPIIKAEFPELREQSLVNAYLETLARGGIPMFLCAMAMCVMLVKPCITLLVAEETEENRGMHVFPIMIGMLLMISVVEVGLFSYANLRNILFFYAAGRVMRACAPTDARDLQTAG